MSPGWRSPFVSGFIGSAVIGLLGKLISLGRNKIYELIPWRINKAGEVAGLMRHLFPILK